MTKKPEYADKITFQGSGALTNAIRCLYKGGVDSAISWKIYRRYHTFQPVKLSDVYRINPSLIGCKKYIREVGKRINDILNSAGIDYKKADFISSSNLYDYPSKCYGRPHIQVYTDEDMFLVDFIKEDEIILRNSQGEEIYFKLEGTYFYDNFKVKKITEVTKEQINEGITYKSFKNENYTIYKVLNDEDRLEVIVGNEEMQNEDNLINTIKNIGLKDYIMEHIFKKIKENVSLQKDDNTYLSIKKYRNSKITDEITIKKGKIKINKFLNNDVSYKLYGNIKGNVDSWQYKGDFVISYNKTGKNNIEEQIEIKNRKSKIDAITTCKEVSDDINNQYKKILSYMKK